MSVTVETLDFDKLIESFDRSVYSRPTMINKIVMLGIKIEDAGEVIDILLDIGAIKIFPIGAYEVIR